MTNVKRIFGLFLGILCISTFADNVGKNAVSTPRISLTADTNRPEMSLYIPGEPIKLSFTVDGLSPDDKDLILYVRILDVAGKEINRNILQVPYDKGAKWTTELDAPVIGLGYYHVCAELSNGVTLPQLGSRPPGFITYAVVPDPSTRKLYPFEQTYFGMCGEFNRKVNALPYLGVRMGMDVQFWWSRTEPDRPGQILEKLKKKEGVEKFPILDNDLWKGYRIPTKDGDIPWTMHSVVTGTMVAAPKWAQVDPTRFPKQGPLSPEGEKAYRNYCLAIGKAYAELYPDRKIHYFEITWEPNTSWSFAGTVEDIVRIYEIAYLALHEADPNAFVIGPCLAGVSSSGLQELEEYLKKGLGKYLDGYSVHPYHAQPCEQEGIVSHLRGTKELLRKYIGKDIPMFGTEMGYRHWGSPGFDLEHAQRITRENLILLEEGFQFNYAFYLYDTGDTVFTNDGGYGFFHNLVQGAPFGPAKGGPKPAASAFAAMSWLLEGHKSARAIEWLGDTAWGYAYENEDDVVLALWDYGDKPTQISVSVGTPEVEVFDWMGNESRVNTSDGELSLTLSENPVYIRGASKTIWGRNAKQLITLSKDHIDGFPGADVTLAGTLTFPSSDKNFDGVLVITPDSKSGLRKSSLPVSLTSSKDTPFSFVMHIPPVAVRGSYPIKLTLEDKNGRNWTNCSVRLAIEPPVKVEHISPVVKPDGTKGIAVTLKNILGNGIGGKVETRIEGVPESKKSVPFSLGANEVKIFAVEYKKLATSSQALRTAVVCVRLDNGYSFEEKARVDFVAATHLTKAPSIDGALAEWENIPSIELKGIENIVRSPTFYSGEMDQNAIVRFAWDDKALYFAIDVLDDSYEQQNTGSLIWRGDALQFGFNIDQGKKFEFTGNGQADASLLARTSEVAFALTKEGPQVYRHITFNREKLKEGLLSKEILPFAVVWQDSHLRYEAAIPWRELGFDSTPKEGDFIGFSLSVNDSDDVKQPDPSALGLYDLKKVGEFGILTLGGSK